MSINNPIIAGIGHIAVPVISSGFSGIPAPSGSDNHGQPTATTSQAADVPAPTLGGIRVLGFKLDANTNVQPGATIIRESLVGAITMAQIAAEKLQQTGPNRGRADPDFLMYFKNDKYYDAILCESASTSTVYSTGTRF